MTAGAAMDTLALDRTTWDLFLDATGNIALAKPPYAQAQDMASAVRTFKGEVYYNTALGIMDFTRILGHLPPPAFLRADLIAAAVTVPGVTSAQAYLAMLDDSRTLRGQVQGRAGSVTAVATTPPASGRPFVLDESILGGGDVLA
jgi:hypothetical protein